MRCGALGHWAADPECKFPTSQGGSGKVHLAIIADEGLSIPAGNESAAGFVVRAKSPYTPDVQAAQSGGKGKGTTTDPASRVNLMIAHWEAFANRLLRKFTRKYMFKMWRIEKRRRAIVMRQNMARRILIHANPQHGPFRPIDIYEDSQSDEEPTISVAPAASAVPTAAPGPGFQPPLRIDRALDVLNAPGSTTPNST